MMSNLKKIGANSARILLGLLVTVGISASAFAQTSSTRATLEAQNNAVIIPNGVGSITGAKLNGMLGNMIASTFTLLDPIPKGLLGCATGPACVPSSLTTLPSALTIPNPTINGGSAAFTLPSSVIQSISMPTTGGGVGFASQMTSLTGSQAYQLIGGPPLYDVLDGVGILAPGSTIWQLNGVAGYVRNQQGQSGGGINAVAVYGQTTCEVNGSACWGINTNVRDDAGPTSPGTGTGRLISNEYDFSISQTGSGVVGSGVGGSSVAQPSSAVGYLCNSLGTGITWNNGCFDTLDGVATTGVGLGAQAASGTNIPSQTIDLGWIDGSSAHQVTLINMQGGFLNIEATSAWEGIALDAGGIFLQTGFTYHINGTPVVSLSGTTTELSLSGTLAAVGSLAFQNSITPSECPVATTSALGCVEIGTGLSVSGGVVSPTFGTAVNQVAEGGIIAASGPTGSSTVAPIITYNAAGQLTVVSSATITPGVGSITGLGTGVATALGNAVNGTGGLAASNASITINSVSCTLQSTCTISAAASLVLASTAISGTGHAVNNILFENPVGTLGEIAAGNSGVLVTSAGGVPSIATTLPSGLSAPSLTVTTLLTVSGSVTNTGETITSASAAALSVGLNGATNPSFVVNDATALQVAGLSVTGAVTGGTVAIATLDSGAASNLTINAKGTGTIGIGTVSTGAITLTRATTMSAALTYGGITLSNAVTGTGNMVLATSPTLATPSIAGSSTGVTTIGSANAGASNFTATLPAATDTLIELTQTQTLTNKTVAFASNTLTGVAPLASPTFTGTVTMPDASSWNSTNLSLAPAGTTTHPTLVFTTCGTNCGILAPAASELEVVVGGANILDYGVTAAGDFDFHATVLMGAFPIYQGGQIFALNTAAYGLQNNAASGTFPTFLPNQTDFKSGIGAAAAGDVSLIADVGGTATEELRADTSGILTAFGAVRMPAIASSSAATTGTLCWTTITGNVTVDTTVACLASLEELKDIRAPIAGAEALSEVNLLRPVWGSWRKGVPEYAGDPAEQPFLTAHQVESVDKRLVGYGTDGALRGVRYMEMSAILTAAVQVLSAQNDSTERRLERLEGAR